MEEDEARTAARELVSKLQLRAESAESQVERAFQENERLVTLLLEKGRDEKGLVSENEKLRQQLHEAINKQQVIAKTCAEKLADATEKLHAQDNMIRQLRNID